MESNKGQRSRAKKGKRCYSDMTEGEPNKNIVKSWPDLLTEQELCDYLRIPQIANGQKQHNVVSNLKRMRGLPCIHICRQPLYPLAAVRRWIEEKVVKEQGR